jgi:hypothetical protein
MEQSDPLRKFFYEMVTQKYQTTKDLPFIENEINKLNIIFGESMLTHFKSKLTENEIEELSLGINKTKDQKFVLSFLMLKIKNFEIELLKYISEFKQKYLNSATSKEI